MKINIIASTQSVLSEYLLHMEEQPAEFFEQMHQQYPWIFSQLERMQTLLHQHEVPLLSVREQKKKKSEALACLRKFVQVFQKMYLTHTLLRKLPRAYLQANDEPLIDFFTRFIEKAKTEAEVLAGAYLSNAPAFHDVLTALSIYKQYQKTASLPLHEYKELLALHTSLRAFFPLIKNISLSKKTPHIEGKNKKAPEWLKIFFKEER